MDFFEIAILISTAAGLGVLAKLLKQPLLVGYLLAGLLLASFGVVGSFESLESFSKIGVALLLFLLGLEMKLNELPTIGKTALITGIGQIVFTSTVGFILSRALGFSSLASSYIAISLTFSSTIIMVKLLSEKKDTSSLYGRIAIGFLLVQDLVAVLILMFLSGFDGGQSTMLAYLFLAFKASLLIIGVWVLQKKILPKFFYKIVGDSTELNFIVSIAWALGFSAFVAGPLGFTIEIGGFLAGLALSNLPEHLQIVSRARPLRDFFLTIFFLYLGSQLVIGTSLLPLVPISVILSLFVLIGNPIIVLLIMGLMRYKKRTSFLAGLTVAQISEFSLILMAMGSGLGHVGEREVAVVVMVGVITMTLSTYMIMWSDKLYKKLRKALKIFERGKTIESALMEKAEMEDHYVLVGCDRTGMIILKYLNKKDKPVIVVDFDPNVHKTLTAENFSVIFGDIEDEEVLDSARLKYSKAVISTINDLQANLTLLGYVNSNLKKKPAMVFTARLADEAVKLYESGADYVVVPEKTAGDYLAHLLKLPGMGKKRFKRMGKSHFDRLLQR